MSLTGQIIRKDLARLRLPLSLWVLFVVGTTVGFGVWGAPGGDGDAAQINHWIEGMNGAGIATVLMQSTVGALLAAVLLLEDRPGGTTAFWMTRPMSGGRMLSAKILGGVFALGLIPALALGVVWLGLGFSVREAFWAAVEHVGWQIVVTVPALAVMALGGGLGRFALVALATWLVVAFTIIAIDVPVPRSLLHPQWVSRRGVFMVGMMLLGAGLALVLAYRRHRVLPVVLWGATLAALITARATVAEDRLAARVPANPAVGGVRWERLHLEDRTPAVTVITPASDAAGEWLAPLAAKVQTASAEKFWELERGPTWAEEAARRLISGKPGAGPVTWRLALGEELARQLRENPALGPGEVRLARMEARVLWELPLRDAAEVRNGGAFAQVVSLGWVENFARRRIVVQERDSRLAIEEGVGANLGGRGMRRYNDYRVDVFLLVNRARGDGRMMNLQEIGTARMNSVLLTARALEFEPAEAMGPALKAWEEQAVIIKVRFTTKEAAVHGLPGGIVPAATEKKT